MNRLVRDFLADPEPTRKSGPTAVRIGGKRVRLIRLLAARACLRVNKWPAML
ncbi:MAG: hypothetical protein M3N38_06715 [Pseudomonadota bacterium]|nr:hypothetical protein [Pseudomonadota bacterium]